MDLEGDVQLAFSDARRFARVRVQVCRPEIYLSCVLTSGVANGSSQDTDANL